jgi:hypothetical protein
MTYEVRLSLILEDRGADGLVREPDREADRPRRGLNRERGYTLVPTRTGTARRAYESEQQETGDNKLIRPAESCSLLPRIQSTCMALQVDFVGRGAD